MKSAYSVLVQQITTAAETGRLRTSAPRAALRERIARANRRGTLSNEQAALLHAVLTAFYRQSAPTRPAVCRVRRPAGKQR